MSPLSAEVVNYGISIFLIIAMLTILQGRARQNPDFKLFGMNIEQLKRVAYVGIGIYLLLILAALFG